MFILFLLSCRTHKTHRILLISTYFLEFFLLLELWHSTTLQGLRASCALHGVSRVSSRFYHSPPSVKRFTIVGSIRSGTATENRRLRRLSISSAWIRDRGAAGRAMADGTKPGQAGHQDVVPKAVLPGVSPPPPRHSWPRPNGSNLSAIRLVQEDSLATNGVSRRYHGL